VCLISHDTRFHVYDLQEKARTLYESPPQLESGNIKVDDVHTIHYRVYGNAKAEKTALFLHGGPGAGCFPNHARFFDPKRWRVVLFDQRGCGSSTPKGCEGLFSWFRL